MRDMQAKNLVVLEKKGKRGRALLAVPNLMKMPLTRLGGPPYAEEN